MTDSWKYFRFLLFFMRKRQENSTCSLMSRLTSISELMCNVDILTCNSLGSSAEIHQPALLLPRGELRFLQSQHHIHLRKYELAEWTVAAKQISNKRTGLLLHQLKLATVDPKPKQSKQFLNSLNLKERNRKWEFIVTLAMYFLTTSCTKIQRSCIYAAWQSHKILVVYLIIGNLIFSQTRY